MPLVLFNVGWMNQYHGRSRSDRIFNGGQYVTDNKIGGEVENFLPLNDRCYAYVRIPRGGGVNMKRLGADANTECLDNVTVVFVATRPGGGSVVVGWYRHARVWRELKKSPHRRYHYVSEAEKKNCILLKVDDRVFPVPRAGPGIPFGIGQSNIRYVDEPSAEPFVRMLGKYLKDPWAVDAPGLVFAPNRPKRGGTPRQPDPVLRAKVEEAAINRVVHHYFDKGYHYESVESENKGWDLEFTRGAVKLLVEVKGCSGNADQVELTPNEYTAMRNRRYRDVYRLAIVTCALDDPKLSIVRFNGSDRTWRDENNRTVRLEERTGARVRIAG